MDRMTRWAIAVLLIVVVFAFAIPSLLHVFPDFASPPSAGCSTLQIDFTVAISPEIANFTDRSTCLPRNGTVMFLWDFGDMHTGAGWSIVHYYSGGSFRVNHSLELDGRFIGSVVKTIYVPA